MKMKVSLPEADVIEACRRFIEDRLTLAGPGWKIECQNSYAFSRDLEFTVEKENVDAA